MPDSNNLNSERAASASTGANELRAALTVNMPVYESQGRRLGTVAAVQLDALTGRLTGIAVRHGFVGCKQARTPTAELLRITHGMVVLAHTKAAFNRLPHCDCPPARTLLDNFTWKR